MHIIYFRGGNLLSRYGTSKVATHIAMMEVSRLRQTVCPWRPLLQCSAYNIMQWVATVISLARAHSIASL